MDEQKLMIKANKKEKNTEAKFERKFSDVFTAVFGVMAFLTGVSIIAFILLTTDIKFQYRIPGRNYDEKKEEVITKDQNILEIESTQFELGIGDKLPSTDFEILDISSDSSIIMKDQSNSDLKKFSKYNIFYADGFILGQITSVTSDNEVQINLFKEKIEINEKAFELSSKFNNFPKNTGKLIEIQPNTQIEKTNYVIKNLGTDYIEISNKLNPNSPLKTFRVGDEIIIGETSYAMLISAKDSKIMAFMYSSPKMVATQNSIFTVRSDRRIPDSDLSTQNIFSSGQVSFITTGKTSNILPFQKIIIDNKIYGEVLDVITENNVSSAIVSISPAVFVDFNGDPTLKSHKPNDLIEQTDLKIAAIDRTNKSIWLTDEEDLFFEVKEGQTIVFENKNIGLLFDVIQISSESQIQIKYY